MKIKRFFAADIRQAMRMVKEELGADAVIMSNRSVDGGVEIVAARDFDEQLIHNKLQKQGGEQLPAQETPAQAAKTNELPDFEAEKKHLHIISNPRKQGASGTIPERPLRRTVEQYVGYAEKIQLRSNQQTPAANIDKTKSPAASTEKPAPVKAPEIKQAQLKQENLSEKLLMEMSKELKYLRTAFDSRLCEVSLVQGAKNNPVRIELLERLTAMSISKKLSVKIANRFINHTDAELIFTKTQELLAKELPIAEDNLMDSGGIVALVGPTGVGKTTTIAKLAAKFILKHGPKQVALITTDNYRIGAHEQINTYGRILDVPVRVASSAEELRDLIEGFADKRLILIDTAGMSQRNMQLVDQINTLQYSGLAIKSYLVMSAATEYQAMNEIIRAFQVFAPQASILTKLDEAATIGSALSAIIEQDLPLAFITDGQQVPEDMHSPCARSLIEHCVAEIKTEYDYNNDGSCDARMAQGYA